MQKAIGFLHLSPGFNGVPLWMDENGPLVFRLNVPFLSGGLIRGEGIGECLVKRLMNHVCLRVRVHYRCIYQFHLKGKVSSCSLENGHSTATTAVYVGVFLELVQLLRGCLLE